LCYDGHKVICETFNNLVIIHFKKFTEQKKIRFPLFSAIANLKVEINPYSESITNEIKGPLSISIPKRFSLTKYMEENFQNAEDIVNDALIKYVGIKDETNLKQQRAEKEICYKLDTPDFR
jgi:hypothetical protein